MHCIQCLRAILVFAIVATTVMGREIFIDNTQTTVETAPYTWQANTLSENTYEKVYLLQNASANIDGTVQTLPKIVCFSGTKGVTCNTFQLNNIPYKVVAWTNHCNIDVTIVTAGDYYNTVGCEKNLDIRLNPLPLYTQEMSLFAVSLSVFVAGIVTFIILYNVWK